jgi:cbb3-type cytochrome oxidase subunit 3
MRHSSFGVLAMLLLLVAVVVFLLAPHERHNASGSAMPGPFWAGRP